MVDFNNRTLGHYKCSCCYCQLADKEQDSTTSQYNLDEHIAMIFGALVAM